MNPAIIAALIQAAPHLLQGLFGNSGDPSRNAGREYKNYYDKNIDAISGEKDPSGFINKLLGDYNQSDWAKNLTHQSTNAAVNAASASGLSGSTPLTQQIQQNAGKIASEDQNQWLQNVLGINKDYLDRFTGLTERQGKHAADASYGQTLGQNSDKNEMMQAFTEFLKTWKGGGGGAGMPAYAQNAIMNG